MSSYFLSSKSKSKHNRGSAEPAFECLLVGKGDKPALAVNLNKQQLEYFKHGFDFGFHVLLDKGTPILQVKVILWAKNEDFLMHYIERIDLSNAHYMYWLKNLVNENGLTCYLFAGYDLSSQISKSLEFSDSRDQIAVRFALRDALKAVEGNQKATDIA